MNALAKRCIDISYRHKLTHVSSVLNTVDVIADIYDVKAPDDPFVLGNSHAALALFVVLESHGLCNAEDMVIRHGTHAVRDTEHGVWVSGGSLGQAETVAVGLAMGYPERNVWLVTSDGACAEGAVYEAFRIANKFCTNLNVTIIYNGMGAYGMIPMKEIKDISNVLSNNCLIEQVNQAIYPPWLRGLAGHYLTLTAEQHQELMQ